MGEFVVENLETIKNEGAEHLKHLSISILGLA